MSIVILEHVMLRGAFNKQNCKSNNMHSGCARIHFRTSYIVYLQAYQ